MVEGMSDSSMVPVSRQLPLSSCKMSGFDQGIDHFFQVKGIGPHLFLDKALQVFRDRGGLQDRGQHFLNLSNREVLELDFPIRLPHLPDLIPVEHLEGGPEGIKENYAGYLF